MSVIALYLTHFNVHKGYEIVWWKSGIQYNHLKDNLEYKTLPSGSHSKAKDIVCFMQTDFDQQYYGLSVFRQNSLNLDTAVDRSLVKMYSLGILVVDDDEFDESSNWKLKVFKNLWKYKDELDIKLSQLMTGVFSAKELDDGLLSLYSKWINESPKKLINKNHSQLNSYQREIKPPDHMIDVLIQMFNKFGPLIYTVWKILLLRKRIILYMDNNNNDNEMLSKFIYCLCLISSIPKGSKFYNNDNSITLPIFNICIMDIPKLNQFENGFIASTSDQIILEKPQLFDYSIKIPHDDNELPIIKSNNNQVIRCTPRDLIKFKLIFKQLNNHSPILNYDSLSAYKSFQEMIYDVMTWWATAGESVVISRENELLLNSIDSDSESNNSNQINKILGLLGYFQRLTTKLFLNTDELIAHNNYLSSQDLIESGLDPFDSFDCEFLLQMIKKWWNRSDVDINSNYLANCLC